MSDQLLPVQLRFFDADGEPLAGGYVTFFVSGTAVLATIYADKDLTTPHANPLYLDGAGVMAQVFYDAAYRAKAVIRTSTGAYVGEIDPVPRASGSRAGAGDTSIIPVAEMPETNVQDALEGLNTRIIANETAIGDLGDLAEEDAATFVHNQATWDAGTETLPRLFSPIRLYTFIRTFLGMTGSAPAYVARTWGTIDGTGTPAIKQAGNVASLIDHGSGEYTAAFTTVLPSANYAFVGTANSDCYVTAVTKAVGSVRFRVVNAAGTPTDVTDISFALIGV